MGVLIDCKDKKILESDTREFIDSYCNTNGRWVYQASGIEKMSIMRNCFIDWDTVQEYIISMEYKDFLNTPYWKAITQYMKHKALERCQACNSTNDLATHHRCYESHGLELFTQQDLVVLCDTCHKKIHNIEVGI